MTRNGNKCPTEPDIRNGRGCPKKPDITSLTSSLQFSSGLEAPNEWSTPTVEELPWSPYWQRIYDSLSVAAA
jgi:hypothetical protein